LALGWRGKKGVLEALEETRGSRRFEKKRGTEGERKTTAPRKMEWWNCYLYGVIQTFPSIN